MTKSEKKKMRKGVKIILIVFLVLLVAVAALCVWQWKNINSMYIAVTETPEEISQRRNDNQEQLVSEVNSYMEGEVRELTEDEKEKIQSGEVSPEEIYAEIFEQKAQEIKENKEENKDTDKDKETVKKPTKDEIISKYMAQIYRLQSEFTAKAESTIKQGAAYYENLKKTTTPAAARQQTISHFTSVVRSVESECDGKIEAIIKNLVNELKAIGEKTDISGTIRAAYAHEKQLKLSYYANKYLK